jgi:beta-lactamase class A
METQTIIQWALAAIAGAYLLTSIFRSRKSLKLQQEAATRSRALIDAEAENESRHNIALEFAKEQSQLMKDIIKEIQGLRDDINRKGV